MTQKYSFECNIIAGVLFHLLQETDAYFSNTFNSLAMHPFITFVIPNILPLIWERINTNYQRLER